MDISMPAWHSTLSLDIYQHFSAYMVVDMGDWCPYYVIRSQWLILKIGKPCRRYQLCGFVTLPHCRRYRPTTLGCTPVNTITDLQPALFTQTSIYIKSNASDSLNKTKHKKRSSIYFDIDDCSHLNKKKLSTANNPAIIPANVQFFPCSIASRIFPENEKTHKYNKV